MHIRRRSKRKSHASISNLDWNKDLSPWESPSLYKKEESFSGGADAYLLLLTEKIIPAICDLLGQNLLMWLLPDIPWQDFFQCIPPTMRKFSHESPVCPVHCGFPVLRNMPKPMSLSKCRIVCIFHLEILNQKQKIRYYLRFRKRPKAFLNCINQRRSR